MNPTVSILIATNNRPEMLKHALQSALDQAFQDFEIIVVDDGQEVSAENTVKQFTDSRISYIKHPEQRGCAGSRVSGINAAQGKYVAFLDDDDTWEPNKLEIQAGRFDDAPEDVGFSFTAVTEVWKDREHITHVPDGVADYHERALLNFSGFLSVTLMFRRSIFAQVGMPDPSFPSHTDIEFILRVSKQFRGLGVDVPLTRVNMKRDHAQMGTDYTNRIRGREMLLEKHKEEFMKRPRVFAKHLFKLGWFYRENGQYAEARRTYARALRLHFKRKYLFNWFVMFGGGLPYRLLRLLKK